MLIFIINLLLAMSHQAKNQLLVKLGPDAKSYKIKYQLEK
jgi:hypothetical protein